MVDKAADANNVNLAREQVNAQIYHAPTIARHYTGRGLDLAESVTLLKYQPAIAAKDVLDIGIGTGRTTKVLTKLARRYVGIDYAEPMVQFARAALPNVEIHCADMRRLDQWAERTFDCVFASNNVVDAVSHEDRLQVFREAHRVLRPGGVVVFSSHNRAAPPDVAMTRPTLQRFKNPITQAVHLRRYLRQQQNFKRSRSFHESKVEYAIMSDIGHDYSLLHYYIDREHQRAQLAALGFELLDTIGRDGDFLTPGDLGESSPSLMYVALRR